MEFVLALFAVLVGIVIAFALCLYLADRDIDNQ